MGRLATNCDQVSARLMRDDTENTLISTLAYLKPYWGSVVFECTRKLFTVLFLEPFTCPWWVSEVASECRDFNTTF